MKRMLFNATQAEELRVAIVDGQKLVDLDIESAAKEQRKGNIYKAVVTRVEPSLEACFVDYGAERHGFLPFKEIARSALPGNANGPVKEQIKEGLELLVQVEKDERGNKGAALTNYISLAGRYLVLMPNNPRGGGVSRRIEGEDRNELRDLLAQLEVPAGTSLIARTAGIGRSLEELRWDLNYLMQLWTAIDGAAQGQKGAFLIYQESSLVIRAIRDYFTADIGELLIDMPAIHEQVRQFMAHVMPNLVSKVKLYSDSVPLFSRFQIEHQIETAYSRHVPLPSGGALVIDHTEALVAIDVNSAQATKGADIEQTALNTNLEAADEAARQLRLRDLGGLVVIDFIDMENTKNQRAVEDRLRDALHADRARIQVGKISRFGLLELSRQRLQPSLGETSHITCPRCMGTGHVRSTESFALHLLRILQEEAIKENTGALHIQAPVDVCTFLLNEKRTDILNAEARARIEILLIPNLHYETPRYTLTRLRHDQLNQGNALPPSYQMVDAPAEETSEEQILEARKTDRPQPLVQGITPSQPAPLPAAPLTPAAPATATPSAKHGLLGRIMGWLRGLDKEPEAPVAADGSETRSGRNEGRSDRNQGRNERSGGRGGRSNSRDRGDRSDRGDRGDRPARAERSERNERPPQGERPARAERPVNETRTNERSERPRNERRRERPSAPPAPLGDEALGDESLMPVLTDAEITTDAPETSVDMEPRESRGRRGRRGGRGRGGREGNREPRAIIEYAAGATPVIIEIAAPVAEAPATPTAETHAPKTIIEYAGTPKAPVISETPSEQVVPTAPAITPEVLVEATAQTPRRANPRRRTQRPAEPEMRMVETAPAVKADEVIEAPEVVEAPVAVERKPRRQTRRPKEAATELVMVETQND